MAKKILIIDDDMEDLDTMKDVLEKGGYSVVTANNGADGLDKVKDGFDLIIIDVQMPTLSGYDLLRLLRERINHDAKMIYATIIPKADVRMEDIDGFIQKPFTSESLLNKVKSLI
ncbi:response regulator transcription factor [Candidatus Woesearchaeota archaeon]|nr:response regulator transcription factor [Candidatus Woesearchaeota archaeon]